MNFDAAAIYLASLGYESYETEQGPYLSKFLYNSYEIAVKDFDEAGGCAIYICGFTAEKKLIPPVIYHPGISDISKLINLVSSYEEYYSKVMLDLINSELTGVENGNI